MRKLLLAAAAATALGALSGNALAAEKISIVAAENFYGDIAKEVGGSHVDVTSIISNPDDDPHLFEASPSTARALADAAIVVYNGADYDPWMGKLLSASPNPERADIVAAKLTGHKDGDNPHLWYDPATAPAVAAAIAAALEKKDPAHAADYAAGLARFDGSLTPVKAKIDEIKSRYKGVAVTATEPVFGYMAQALGFEMRNMAFQNAVMNDAEPTPSQVAAFESDLKSGTVKILFYNSQVTDSATERLLAIAKQGGVPVVGVTETAPAGKTFAAWMLGELDAVEAALKHSS